MQYKLGELIKLSEEKNHSLQYDSDHVRGISTAKEFIQTKADLDGVKMDGYKVVKPFEFAYVADTSRRGDKISLAFNLSNESYLVSSISTVFKLDEKELDSSFLYMFFNRPEFDRYARYHSWGSAREVFSWVDLCEVKIPVPDLDIQKSIVDIYKVYLERKAISEKLKEQIKNICPVLIKGATDEAKKLKTAS